MEQKDQSSSNRSDPKIHVIQLGNSNFALGSSHVIEIQTQADKALENINDSSIAGTYLNPHIYYQCNSLTPTLFGNSQTRKIAESQSRKQTTCSNFFSQPAFSQSVSVCFFFSYFRVPKMRIWTRKLPRASERVSMTEDVGMLIVNEFSGEISCKLLFLVTQ